ncbi:MAG: acyltransferase [Dehalococcoidia bacterium]|nr:MAG: acyltransferase [Dehalococcoidia bacterium]
MAEDREAALDPQPDATAGRIVAIDVVRGFAILWVILYHLWSDLKYPHIMTTGDTLTAVVDRARDADAYALLGAITDVFFRLGFLGVPLFMVLSGLSLTMSAMRRPLTPRGTPSFMYRRFRRVMIPYWFGFAYAVVFALGLALVQWQRHGGHPYWWFARHGDVPLTGGQLFAGGLLVPRYWANDWQFAPEGSLWFVLLIVQYYLLFPFLLVLLKRISPLPFVALALAVTLLSLDRVLSVDGDLVQAGSWVTMLAPFRIFEFALGMAGGYLLVRRPMELRRALRSPLAAGLVMSLGLAAFIAGNMIDTTETGRRVIAQGTLIALGMSLFFLPVVVKAPGRVEAWAPGRLLAWVGVISYTVLIVNEPFRSVTHTMRLEHAWMGWRALWVGVWYMPATLLLARPLAVLLGLVERQPKPEAAAPPLPVAAGGMTT